MILNRDNDLFHGHADLLSSRIRNYGRMFERRVAFTIGVTYQTPREQLKQIPAIMRAAIEAQERTRFDLEMMIEMGYCHGIENYSRHLTGRQTGEAPPTLLDYLPDNAIVFIDESHVTLPQLRAMSKAN